MSNTVKKMNGQQTKSLSFDASAHKIGLDRIDAIKTWENNSKEILKEDINKVYDYIFGKSDENPLESVTKVLYDTNDELDKRLEKLVNRIKGIGSVRRK